MVLALLDFRHQIQGWIFKTKYASKVDRIPDGFCEHAFTEPEVFWVHGVFVICFINEV